MKTVFFIYSKSTVLVILFAWFFCCVSCVPQWPATVEPHEEEPPIFPAYQDGIMIPCNIASLNFTLPDSVKRVHVKIRSSSAQKTFVSRRQVKFKQKFWKELMVGAMHGKRDTIVLNLAVRGKLNRYSSYAEIRWIVCPEPIDSYLTYRLVQPTAGTYRLLEIRERCLENFTERVLASNRLMNENCFNCHTYHQGEANRMMMHLRNPSEGSLFFYDGDVQKVRLPSADKALAMLPDSLRMPLRFIYAAWHPEGEYIAFSTNIVGLSGYTARRQYVDLLDTASNIILYHPQSNTITLPPALWTAGYEETWPSWSADGKWLYFCRTAKMSLDTLQRYPEFGERVQHIFFDLCRVAFDATVGRFADTVQLVLKSAQGRSYSVPRVHPDGKKLLVCRGLFNSVPYHSLGDLELVDLQSDLDFKSSRDADILNSSECESWHEWSSNGFWVVYSSKRQDGHYSLPYLAYFDGKNFGKPFVLPQSRGDFYQTSLRAFNLPTFTRTRSALNPTKVVQARQAPVMEIGVRNIEDSVFF